MLFRWCLGCFFRKKIRSKSKYLNVTSSLEVKLCQCLLCYQQTLMGQVRNSEETKSKRRLEKIHQLSTHDHHYSTFKHHHQWQVSKIIISDTKLREKTQIYFCNNKIYEGIYSKLKIKAGHDGIYRFIWRAIKVYIFEAYS